MRTKEPIGLQALHKYLAIAAQIIDSLESEQTEVCENERKRMLEIKNTLHKATENTKLLLNKQQLYAHHENIAS